VHVSLAVPHSLRLTVSPSAALCCVHYAAHKIQNKEYSQVRLPLFIHLLVDVFFCVKSIWNLERSYVQQAQKWCRTSLPPLGLPELPLINKGTPLLQMESGTLLESKCRLRRTVELLFRFLDAVVSVSAPTLEGFSISANVGS
jgi:hypothetical protein